ncbi:MAG: methylated-DNA--[protein]-cysteine S-methyltransferase [Lachnospiraceae bacterium]
MYYQTTYDSPIGKLTLVSDDDALIGLWIEGQKFYAQGIPEERITDDKHPVLTDTKDWLDMYFSKNKPCITNLPLAPMGTVFQQTIWHLLCDIPYGETTTYGKLAKKAASQLKKDHMSAQAVGGAIAHNPISIIIPCHRVVGTNGSLVGYTGGLKKKRWLLEHEKV